MIVISQFAGTSLWFAGNAVLPEMQKALGFQANAATLTSLVQLGFISGTLLFALFSIADRFSPSKVFFFSSILAAAANLSMLRSYDIGAIYALRFLTGFFLAGIYPVGMKIAADWYEQGLGKALGYLVGALVLGSAFPYLLRSGVFTLSWQAVLISTSSFALLGGLLILFFVGDGPFRKTATRFNVSVIGRIFYAPDFRAAAVGYFGHMWELYAFWAFAPAMIARFLNEHQLTANSFLWSFIIIAMGAVGCIAGGYFSKIAGSTRVAFYSLLCSGICCIIALTFSWLPPVLFFFIIIFWGVTIAADSPQFSALVTKTAVPEYKGTALTMVTCIGFAISIVSIQLLQYLVGILHADNYFVLVILGLGPLTGLIGMRRLLKKQI